MKDVKGKTQDGVVMEVSNGKLTTTCKEGNQHNYTIAKDANVSLDGKACKSSDFKVGSTVRVTEHRDDKTIATAIECGKNVPAINRKG